MFLSKCVAESDHTYHKKMVVRPYYMPTKFGLCNYNYFIQYNNVYFPWLKGYYIEQWDFMNRNISWLVTPPCSKTA